MHRWYYALLIALTVAMGWFGLSRLNYNVDPLDLLPRNMAGLEGTRVMRDTFQKANRLVITIEHEDPLVAEAAALSLADHLGTLKEWCHKVSARPPIDRGSGASAGPELAEMAAYALLNAPPDRVRALSEKLSGAGAERTAAAMLEELATSQDAQVMAACATQSKTGGRAVVAGYCRPATLLTTARASAGAASLFHATYWSGRTRMSFDS